MKNRRYIFLFLLIFTIVFSLSAVSADDLETTDSGEVSGDVDVVTTNPGSTYGELEYDIPHQASDIKSAHVYVNIYSGSGSSSDIYKGKASVNLTTTNGENQVGDETLYTSKGTADGEVHIVNDHVTKCFSDYQIYYNITNMLQGLNGTHIKLKVNTAQEGSNFTGEIKLIGLILAYDDGDNDKMSYWINSGQAWTTTNTTTQFNTAVLENPGADSIIDASLINIALSSQDGSYSVNGEPLKDAEVHINGNYYYKYNQWYIGDKIRIGENTTLTSKNNGYSLKNVLSILKVKSETIHANATLSTEYTSTATCYAGTNNTIIVNVTSDKEGRYLIELLADGEVVDSCNVDLDGLNKITILLNDSTIRDIDETTVNGANNKIVNYTVNIKYHNQLINSTNKEVPVLYNGYLGKYLEYNATYMENFKNITITGDIVIDMKDTYLKGANATRTDIWNINLNNASNFVNAFVYISYNWDKTPGVNGPELNITFNGQRINPVYHFRDQSNLGSGASAKYGYGLFIYDVSNLIQNGNNTLVLNKATSGNTTNVYPSTLIYLYNTTGSDIQKTVYIANGADLLMNSYNNASRTIKSDSEINVNVKNLNDAQLYVFASGGQNNEGNIIFNSNEYSNVWNGSDSSYNVYNIDISRTIRNSNKISFVATGNTILALQQIIVTSTNITKPEPQPKPQPQPQPQPVTKKVKSKITAKKATFKAKTKVKKYTITLINKKTGKAIKKVKVSLKIGKKTYKATTNTKGKATFKITKLTKKGKYTAKISYNGNKNYYKTSVKVKITIKK